MTNKECINDIELIKAAIEWELPINYQITPNHAIGALMKIDKIKSAVNSGESIYHRMMRIREILDGKSYAEETNHEEEDMHGV